MKITKSQLREIIREEIQRVNERRSYYRKEPVWMKAKYPGVDVNGKPFKRGEEVLYYPTDKVFYTGKEAQKAWKDFMLTKQDDEWMASQFPRYR